MLAWFQVACPACTAALQARLPAGTNTVTRAAESKEQSYIRAQSRRGPPFEQAADGRRTLSPSLELSLAEPRGSLAEPRGSLSRAATPRAGPAGQRLGGNFYEQ